MIFHFISVRSALGQNTSLQYQQRAKRRMPLFGPGFQNFLEFESMRLVHGIFKIPYSGFHAQFGD